MMFRAKSVKSPTTSETGLSQSQLTEFRRKNIPTTMKTVILTVIKFPTNTEKLLRPTRTDGAEPQKALIRSKMRLLQLTKAAIPTIFFHKLRRLHPM